MIYKITTKSEIAEIEGKLPDRVIIEVKRIADILDTYYNSQGMDGGYILIAEDIADLDCVKNEYFDYADMVYEFKDNLSDWVSVLYLVGTEYSITLIAPQKSLYSEGKFTV